MIRRTFMLTDLEGRALAACDDQHLAVPTAQAILSSWFVRDIATGEMPDVCARLSELGLLKTYVRRTVRLRCGLPSRVTRQSSRTAGLSGSTDCLPSPTVRLRAQARRRDTARQTDDGWSRSQG